MPTPATTGQLRDKIEDMEIGDYIKLTFNNPTFVLGGSVELPVTPKTTWSFGEFLYLIKVDKGLLIADRVGYTSISWDALNNAKLIEGYELSLGTTNGILRSPTGGVAYADANGNRSLTDQNHGGWPTNNEWDRYILNFPINKIQVGKKLDDVFHYNSNATTWTQDTTANNVSRVDGTMQGGNTIRVYRGILSPETSLLSAFGFVGSNASSTRIGFRPVFEYKEV